MPGVATVLEKTLSQHHGHRVPADLSKFWVISVISNPVRYKRRYELYHPFAEMVHQAGVQMITVLRKS